jgi:hypothetical protein
VHAVNFKQRKTEGISTMKNPETLETLAIQDTGKRQTNKKQQTKKQTNKQKQTQNKNRKEQENKCYTQRRKLKL